MKVLKNGTGCRIVVHTSEPRSGAARYVLELVEALAKIDIPVVLLCPSNFEYVADVHAAGIDIVLTRTREVERGNLPMRVLRNIKFILETCWKQWSITQRGDIVHFQFPVHFPLGLVFFILAKLKRCQIVFTAHDPLPHKPLWPGRFHSVERWMTAYAYKLSNRVIVHNSAGYDTLVEEFQVDAAKVAVINHGPFQTETRPAVLPSFDDLRLLAFGSIRQNKGTHLAIQAVQLLNAMPGKRVHLTIAGTVANAREESYWAECKALIKQAPENIEVIERHISDAEIGPLVNNHHVLVLPYLEFSSESGVASLALSNRRPILATTAGGLGTLLASSACGLLIDPPTVEGVAAAIAKAMQAGPDFLQLMGAEGAVFISSHRSWHDIALLTATLYTGLLGHEQCARVDEEVPTHAEVMVE